MRKKLFFSLTLTNALVAMALWATPALAPAANASIPPPGRQDCCKSDGPMPYCCMSCCWLVPDCDGSADCG
jgi:hypothetical protein